MSDTVQSTPGASTAGDAAALANDNAALADAFQSAIISGTGLVLGISQPDGMEDATSDPDAPF